ncbi:MAG: tetratricopeptide repeat protein [Rickettsiales bacterium]
MKHLLLATTSLFLATSAFAQPASMQSPAYQECSALAASDPQQALVKAEAWLKIDTGVAAQHCRAMALYGMRQFPEAAAALVTVRDTVAPENITLRSYVTRQATRAYINANQGDKAIALVSAQINDISNFRNDNGNAAHLASELLRERARINASYGKLDDATKDLDHAVSLTPVNEELLLERSAVFEQLGDLPLARNDVDAVLTINSANSKARSMRDRLYAGTPMAGTFASPPVAAGMVNEAGEAVHPVKKRVAKKKRVVKKTEAVPSVTEAVEAPVVPAAPAPVAAVVAPPAAVAPAPVVAAPKPAMSPMPALPPVAPGASAVPAMPSAASGMPAMPPITPAKASTAPAPVPPVVPQSNTTSEGKQKLPLLPALPPVSHTP